MDMPMVRRVERLAVRMQQMMDRVGADAATLARLRAGDAFLEARTACLHCGTSDRCLRWLDAAPRRTAERPHFCPNIGLFEACRRDVPRPTEQ